MDNKKVMVTSMVDAIVGVDIPELNLRRTWEKKGAKKPIDFDVLQQAIYDPGVEYMLEQGILYIEDMDVKIALGLEPEGAKEPQNIVLLTDKQKTRLLTIAPISELKQRLKTMPYEAIQDLAQFAIEHEYADLERCNIIKEVIGTDIISAIRLNKQAKEDTKK